MERIFLTGGSSKLLGIKQIFENYLKIDCVQLNFDNKNLTFNSSGDVDYNSFSQAFATAFRGNLAPLNSRINIRHGDLALISNYEKVISEVFKYAKITFIFATVLIGTYFLRYFLFEHRIHFIFHHITDSLFFDK